MRETIVDEAKRRLQCQNPRCMTGCPVHTPIKEAIGLFRSGHIEQAGKLLIDNSDFHAVGGFLFHF